MPSLVKRPAAPPARRNAKGAQPAVHEGTAPLAPGPLAPVAGQSFLEDPSDDEQQEEEEEPAPIGPGGPSSRWRKPPPLLVPDSIFVHTNAVLPAAAEDADPTANESTPKPGSHPATLPTSKPARPSHLRLDLVPEVGVETPGVLDSPAPNASRDSLNYHIQLAEQLARLGLAGRRKSQGPLVWSNDDLVPIRELGAGNGGTVTMVRHVPTDQVMAKKTVFTDAQSAVRKQILRELQIMHECCHPSIIEFFGAFQNEFSHICMCMEYMDKGSLDQIYKDRGPIPYPVCARVAYAVVTGLDYLYGVHRILHRDVKPSNILANSQGQLKLCDFGLSGELTNSLSAVTTFVGTSAYMAPERIKGDAYTLKSDVWSLGMTLIELALGRFPISDEDQGVSCILDLLQTIVHEPSAQLPDHYEPELRSFTDACLLKDPEDRPAPKELLEFPLIKNTTLAPLDLAAWLNADI